MADSRIDNILTKICADKISHIKEQKQLVPQGEIIQRATYASPPRGFHGALLAKVSRNTNALIAEIKKASPSRGIIRRDFNPAEIAMAYEKGGATCISVLTDRPYFQGDDENIKIAHRACNLPILRKDFMLDTYQIFESRALGADCILLIIAALSSAQADELEHSAMELGMDVLVEVHDAEELERALLLKSKLIGINNRNLKTLVVDIGTTTKLAAMIPHDRTIVCESGITGHKDILNINKAGVYSFLVGESLMLQNDIELATRSLLNASPM